MSERGIGSAELSLGPHAVRLLVEEIPSEVTESVRAEALQWISRRDLDDRPIPDQKGVQKAGGGGRRGAGKARGVSGSGRAG